MTNTERLPKMMTIRQVAATGLLPETALRRLAAEDRLPALKVGNRMLINFDLLVEQLNGQGRALMRDSGFYFCTRMRLHSQLEQAGFHGEPFASPWVDGWIT